MSTSWMSHFEVYGLWGSRSFTLNAPTAVNIIHGDNGTGKTTTINLLVAALLVNIKMLNSIDFDRIKITFKNISSTAKPVIELAKTINKIGDISYKYSIRHKTTSEPFVHVFKSRQETGAPRHYEDHMQHFGRMHRLRFEIESIVSVTWLSVERGVPESREIIPVIDQKIKSLSSSYQLYCAELNKKELNCKESFQQSVFLSFLSNKRKNRFIDQITKLDLDREKSMLIEIYEKFNLMKDENLSKIESHFAEANEAIDSLQSNKNLSFEKLLTIFDVGRAHAIVEEWIRQRDGIAKLYSQKEIFFNTINGLLHYKKLHEDSKNNLSAITESGKNLDLSNMSSGEKQLFILLCEALLQNQRPCIYIADEPELSLHVKWQELLIDSIRSINSNAQILFATHSPDIVSHYGDFTIDMEDVLNGTN